MRRIILTLALLVGWAAGVGRADMEAQLSLENRTGGDKTDWPIFLTVWKVFGADLDVGKMDREGFHVLDAAGQEVPYMLRSIPPDFSLGNDEIVFVVPKMRVGESLKFHLTQTKTRGLTQTIDLAGNPNNLLPNGGFEALRKNTLEGYEVTAGRGVEIAADGEMKHSGRQSLRVTIPVGSTVSLRTGQPVRFREGGQYHFSFWAKTNNVAYTGWGFWNDGGTVGLRPAAFRGREKITLRGTRDWYCYTFEPGGVDEWGVPAMTCAAQAETIKKNGRDAPDDLWQKGGQAVLTIDVRQANQPFLKDDKTGRMWLDEILLFEQPAITVERAGPLEQVARNSAVIFSRPAGHLPGGVAAGASGRQWKGPAGRGRVAGRVRRAVQADRQTGRGEDRGVLVGYRRPGRRRGGGICRTDRVSRG
jgi:hypothetical protein